MRLRRRLDPAVLALLAASALTLTAACSNGNGGGNGGDGLTTVTGRVMSLTADRYCVSPDRGETQTCVDIPAGNDGAGAGAKAVQGIDVGECVTTTPDLTSEGSFVKVVGDAACAAGDLGEKPGD